MVEVDCTPQVCEDFMVFPGIRLLPWIVSGSVFPQSEDSSDSLVFV